MSVPTIRAMVSGKTNTITSPKYVPLPTDVRPTTKPNTAPVAIAMSLSRCDMMNGPSLGWIPRFTNDFARNPMPPRISATPIA